VEKKISLEGERQVGTKKKPITREGVKRGTKKKGTMSQNRRNRRNEGSSRLKKGGRWRKEAGEAADG